MKSCVLLVLVTVAAAAAYEEPARFYHESVGIPEAERIRRYELASAGNRITGGESVAPGELPHLGGLLIRLRDGRQSMCGCSMLSNTRAVTAAHCWWDGQAAASELTVVYGSNRMFSGGTRVNTNDVQTHQNYSSTTLQNDIAIITHQFVGYSRTINRIKLPSGSQLNSDFAAQTATATGYGFIGENSGIKPNQEKRKVDVQVITNVECLAVFGGVTDSTLCTSGEGGRSICFGDSGGPLSVGEGENRILIGVSSFISSRGCTSGRPAGYVRVTALISWIQQRL